jgi:hypothetical protein
MVNPHTATRDGFQAPVVKDRLNQCLPLYKTPGTAPSTRGGPPLKPRVVAYVPPVEPQRDTRTATVYSQDARYHNCCQANGAFPARGASKCRYQVPGSTRTTSPSCRVILPAGTTPSPTRLSVDYPPAKTQAGRTWHVPCPLRPSIRGCEWGSTPLGSTILCSE